MLCAFFVGTTVEKYRQAKFKGYEEETFKKIKQQMQIFVQELELTGSGIIVEIEECQEKLKDLLDDADRKIAVLRLGNAPSVGSEEKETKQEKINRLFKQGDDVAAIARKTGSNQGEVQLILGLLNKQINK